MFWGFTYNYEGHRVTSIWPIWTVEWAGSQRLTCRLGFPREGLQLIVINPCAATLRSDQVGNAIPHFTRSRVSLTPFAELKCWQQLSLTFSGLALSNGVKICNRYGGSKYCLCLIRAIIACRRVITNLAGRSISACSLINLDIFHWKLWRNWYYLIHHL